MTATPELSAPPTRRAAPLDPPPEFRRLREEAPISRFRWPNGIEAWLVTRYRDVRAVLADPRVSVDKSKSPPPSLSIGRKSTVMLPKSLISMDPPEHSARRQLYMRELTVRRMERLRPRIEEIVAEYLDAVQRAGRPADLVPTFTLPIPSMVICELLGVPTADRAEFQRQTQVILGVESDAEAVSQATKELVDYLRDLVALRRRHAGEDMLSRLAGAEVDGAPLAEDELVGHAMLLLIAGHETTANMLAISIATLLLHPERLAALRARPEQTAGVVEELLRYHAVIQYGLVRRVTADMVVGTTSIRAGEWIVCSLASANRDETVCSHADTFDPDREQARQISFGYGIHQCAGQNLARLELEVALAALLGRFPELSLAVPPGDLRFRSDAWVYGLHSLPVNW